ncbi:hypothetical protein [Aquiflexum gelatinilyticum]|uniref:Uncharacterized protein n=1 Tax=Aquiflexum gelatinilyticum TaxID=2961943 RepID=A0A9X2P8H2_9BACT|nr:hypothetical protein [Aquiflexum gelatinilyticum]MCR9014050.1 hypothetical protein [Aquiflexum gelatinilyticum]
MLTKILLPHKFQMIGWILFFPLAILLVLNGFYDYEINWLTWNNFRSGDILNSSNENFTNEISIVGTFLSLFFIAFSKEKQEDEYIQKIRLDSLLIAFYVYGLLTVFGTLVFYSVGYLEFMGFNMFSIQLVFIIRFRWVMYRQQETLTLI